MSQWMIQSTRKNPNMHMADAVPCVADTTDFTATAGQMQMQSNSSFHPHGLEKNLPKAGGGLEKLQLYPGPVSCLMQSSLSLVGTRQRTRSDSLPSHPFKYCWKIVPRLQDCQLQQKTDYVPSLQKSKAEFEAEFKSPDSHCFVLNKYVPFVADIWGKAITSSAFK